MFSFSRSLAQSWDASPNALINKWGDPYESALCMLQLQEAEDRKTPAATTRAQNFY